MHRIVITMLMAACATAPAIGADRTGYQAIVAGDFGTAVKRIEAERRIFPQRAELKLNLAVAHAKIGRTTEARTLYRDVLAQPAVAMDMPDGTVLSSHDVADRGLTRLMTTTVATR